MLTSFYQTKQSEPLNHRPCSQTDPFNQDFFYKATNRKNTYQNIPKQVLNNTHALHAALLKAPGAA